MFPSSAASTAVWSMYSSPRSCGRRSTFQTFPFWTPSQSRKSPSPARRPPTRASRRRWWSAAASASAAACAAACGSLRVLPPNPPRDPVSVFTGVENLRGPERIRASVWRCRGIRERHRRRDGRARGESFQLERRRRPHSYIAFTLMDIRSERWCFFEWNNPRRRQTREAGGRAKPRTRRVRDLTGIDVRSTAFDVPAGASPPPRSPRARPRRRERRRAPRIQPT